MAASTAAARRSPPPSRRRRRRRCSSPALLALLPLVAVALASTGALAQVRLVLTRLSERFVSRARRQCKSGERESNARFSNAAIKQKKLQWMEASFDSSLMPRCSFLSLMPRCSFLSLSHALSASLSSTHNQTQTAPRARKRRRRPRRCHLQPLPLARGQGRRAQQCRLGFFFLSCRPSRLDRQLPRLGQGPATGPLRRLPVLCQRRQAPRWGHLPGDGRPDHGQPGPRAGDAELESADGRAGRLGASGLGAARAARRQLRRRVFDAVDGAGEAGQGSERRGPGVRQGQGRGGGRGGEGRVDVGARRGRVWPPRRVSSFFFFRFFSRCFSPGRHGHEILQVRQARPARQARGPRRPQLAGRLVAKRHAAAAGPGRRPDAALPGPEHRRARQGAGGAPGPRDLGALRRVHRGGQRKLRQAGGRVDRRQPVVPRDGPQGRESDGERERVFVSLFFFFSNNDDGDERENEKKTHPSSLSFFPQQKKQKQNRSATSLPRPSRAREPTLTP